MVHSLLLTSQYDLPVRGKDLEISVSVTNIGDYTFPGGKIEYFRVNFPDIYTAAAIEVPPISPIHPEHDFIFKHTFLLKDEGFAWIEVKLSSNDGEPVDHYRNRQSKSDESWIHAIYVDNPLLMKIIQQLEEISNQLRGATNDRRKKSKKTK